MPLSADESLRELLGLSPVAMIGVTDSPDTPSHDVPAYLIDHGTEIIPINPNYEQLFGQQVYPSLERVPRDCPLVTVFGSSAEVPRIVDVAIDRNDVVAVWLQQDIRHSAAVTRGEQAGLLIVQDRCMRIEYDRLISRE